MDAEVTFRTASRGSVGAEPAEAGVRLPSVLAAAALHMAFVVALGLVFRIVHVPPPPADIGMPVVFAPAPAEPPGPAPRLLAPGTIPVRTTQVPALVVPLRQVELLPHPSEAITHGSPAKLRAAQIRRLPTPAPQATTSRAMPSPAAGAVVPVPVTMPPASPHDMLRAMAGWEARIRQAVQDAAIYPASARQRHRDGGAQVRFEYDRGAIEDAAIAQTSHVGALDDAALAAVTRAAIPNPPAELGPQKRIMLVWVQFRLVSEE